MAKDKKNEIPVLKFKNVPGNFDFDLQLLYSQYTTTALLVRCRGLHHTEHRLSCMLALIAYSSILSSAAVLYPVNVAMWSHEGPPLDECSII